MASKLEAMASNLIAMASDLITMASSKRFIEIMIAVRAGCVSLVALSLLELAAFEIRH